VFAVAAIVDIKVQPGATLALQLATFLIARDDAFDFRLVRTILLFEQNILLLTRSDSSQASE